MDAVGWRDSIGLWAGGWRHGANDSHRPVERRIITYFVPIPVRRGSNLRFSIRAVGSDIVINFVYSPVVDATTEHSFNLLWTLSCDGGDFTADVENAKANALERVIAQDKRAITILTQVGKL